MIFSLSNPRKQAASLWSTRVMSGSQHFIATFCNQLRIVLRRNWSEIDLLYLVGWVGALKEAVWEVRVVLAIAAWDLFHDLYGWRVRWTLLELLTELWFSSGIEGHVSLLECRDVCTLTHCDNVSIWCPVVNIWSCLLAIDDASADAAVALPLLITHSILSLLLRPDQISDALVCWWASMGTAGHLISDRFVVAVMTLLGRVRLIHPDMTESLHVVNINTMLYSVWLLFHGLWNILVKETEVYVLESTVTAGHLADIYSDFFNARWLLAWLEPSSHSTRLCSLELLFSKWSSADMFAHLAE